jgi:hypothetical protein
MYVLKQQHARGVLMPGEAAFYARNDFSRDRLKLLCQRLYEIDLLRPMGEGWTVSAKLAHTAFWERQVLLVLEALMRTDARRGDVAAVIARSGEWLPIAAVKQWQRAGVDWSGANSLNQDALNDGALPAWLLVPPHVALRQAVNNAEVLDSVIAGLAPRIVSLISSSQIAWMLEPGRHRAEHLDEVERALSSTPAAHAAAVRHTA